VFRGVVFFRPVLTVGKRAVITTMLQRQAVAAWDQYIAAFESHAAPARPLLTVKGDKPTLIDLNVNGDVAEDSSSLDRSGTDSKCKGGRGREGSRRLRSHTRIYAPDCKIGRGQKDRAAQLRRAIDHGAIETIACTSLRYAFASGVSHEQEIRSSNRDRT